MTQKVIGISCFNRRQIIDKFKIEPAAAQVQSNILFPVGAVLEGLNGLWFDALELSASHTNHDHGDLLESIEVFRTLGYRKVKK